MKYMTEQLMQRFTSNMATMLRAVQGDREMDESQIKYFKESESKYRTEALGQWYTLREFDKKDYIKLSSLQSNIKRGFLTKPILQKMEKVVTIWLRHQQEEVLFSYENYLDNRYNNLYRNRTKQEKKKLAKLVELQQAIRKEKSVNKY